MESKIDKASVVNMRKINDKLPKLTSTIEVRSKNNCIKFSAQKFFFIFMIFISCFKEHT